MLFILLFILVLWIAYRVPEDLKSQKRLKEIERKYEYWKEYIEPRNREVGGYPDDWQSRRRAVYEKANGRCASCGAKVGVIEQSRWKNKLILREAHVHHKVPISRGGDHSLSNLELLCENCHINTHPENRGFEKTVKISRNQPSLFFGRDAAVRKAKKDWECALCEDPIPAGNEYYGDQWNKVCMACFKSNSKLRRRIK